MQLRVRRRTSGSSVTARVTIGQNATRQELVAKLAALVESDDFPPLPASWDLSLNGKTPLASVNTSLLSALGLCSGDLVYVIDTPDQAGDNAVQFNASATQLPKDAQPDSQAASAPAVARKDSTPKSAIIATEPTPVPPDMVAQDPNIAVILTAMSNYGFHLPPSASAPALLSQGALQSITLLASFAPEAAVVLKLVAMGGQLCLHARWRHIDQQGPVFSLTSPSLTRPTPTQCHRCRRKIQDTVVHPLSLNLRSHLQLPSMDCLTGLPAEVKVRILGYLDHRSLTRMAQVNKEFNVLCGLPMLWQAQLRLLFGISTASTTAQAEFISQYRKQQQRLHHRMQQREETPWYSPQDIRAGWFNPNMFLPPPPRAPRAIGGDYDIFPYLPFFPHARRPDRRDVEPWDA
eukprot:TRINITY_DN3072_c0_g1_i1.p1 TRINITY_DN3072_c0_g1~~TRINITY_DN3072_c0_g1_i1.p1  ORF type:complete len:405 (+),score=56.31 TRINITY_DN3072_c0_g1_i1:349-1563(+)